MTFVEQAFLHLRFEGRIKLLCNMFVHLEHINSNPPTLLSCRRCIFPEPGSESVCLTYLKKLATIHITHHIHNVPPRFPGQPGKPVPHPLGIDVIHLDGMHRVRGNTVAAVVDKHRVFADEEVVRVLDFQVID